MAAVALLFALFAFKQPPFVLIYEMDAALDAKNVRALGRFVSQIEKPQVIVIYLKESLYTKAKGLIGVYKDRIGDNSGMVCLDLTKYASVEDEMEDEFGEQVLQIAGG